MRSASALPLLAACPGSAALGKVESSGSRADAGSAGHEHMCDRARLGVQAAIERLDEVVQKWGLVGREADIFVARCKAFEWCPPAGAFGEVALALWPDGSVSRVKGGRGEYDATDAITAGTIDVMWSEPEPLDLTDPLRPRCPTGSVLWVPDYKFGSDVWVEPVEHNIQIAAYTVMAAKWTGAAMAVPAVIYPRKGQGEWDVPEAPWGVEQLEVAERIVANAASRDSGPLVEGKHCEYCPSFTRCPAKTALMRSVIEGKVVPETPAALTVDEARWLATFVPQLRKFADAGDKLLRKYVDYVGSPVEIGHELVWGPVEKEVTRILPKVGESVLAAELGEHLASLAVEQSMSRDRIEEAIKAHLEANGKARGVAPIMRKVMAKIGEAGGLVAEPRTEYRAHRRGE